MGKREAGKPRGRMSSYAYFVQCCREEHKKKHPGENVVFAEFTRKCAEKWKEMSPKEKHRFEDMAEKDKARYEKEMANYTPVAGAAPTGRGKKRTKDPNAPKRALSAFFLFCNEERPKVRAAHPGYTVGEVAKDLGKRWEQVKDRTKWDKMAEGEKKKYEIAMAAYKAGLGSPQKKAPARSPAKKQRVEESEEEDDDDEEEEDDDDDDDDE